MTNKIWNLIKTAVILAVSASSHAEQDTVYFGLRFGVQYVPHLCKDHSGGQSCNDNVGMANPYLRFNIDGPHNIEIGARATLTDYQASVGNNTTASMNSSSLSISYEVRPFSGQEPGPIAIRMGWHYTTRNLQETRFQNTSHSGSVPVTNAHAEDVNGFIVGLGFDPFRHVNLAFDYADWDGDEAMSLMLGIEI